MTIQDINYFHAEVEKIIAKYMQGDVTLFKWVKSPSNPEEYVLMGFVPELWNLISTEKSKYLESKTCGDCLQLPLNQLEYQMVMLSIISMSWVCQMRKIKIKEGQCWNPTHIKPCPDASKCHNEFYEYLLAKMTEALDIIKSDLPQVVKTG